MTLTYAEVYPHIQAGLSPAEIASLLVSSRLTHNDVQITSSETQEDSIIQILSFEFPVMRMRPSNQGWKGLLVALSEDTLLDEFPPTPGVNEGDPEVPHPLRGTAEAINAALVDHVVPLALALETLTGFLQIQNQKLSSSISVTSANALYLVTEVVKALAPLIPVPGGVSAEQIDARMNGIHGGRRYDDVTEAVVQAVIDEEVERVAADEAQQATSTALVALEDEYAKQYNQKIAPLINAENTTAADWVLAIQQMATDFGS